MTLEQLIEAARKAILDGDLEKAEKLTNQAKAMKALDGLQPVENEEMKTLKTEVETLRAKLAKIEAEPPSNKAGVVVTQDETDKKAAQPWATLGEQLKAVHVAATKPYQTDERLKAQKAILGASEGVPSDGGFLVQPNFATEIFKIAHDGGQILQRTRRIPVGGSSNGLTMNAVDETSRATGSRWGGVQAYWAAEGEAGTATKPKFRQLQLQLNKLLAFFYATDELLADTTALGAVAQQAIAEEITWTAENAIFRGTGAGQPAGILNDGSLVTISKETGQAAATLVVQNFFKMYARLWSRSRSSAVWFYNQDIEPQLFGMDFPVGTGGVPAYLPPGGLSASPFGTLLGRPMIPIEYASTLGTVGDIILADFSQYLTIDKDGIQSAESMHVQFLTDQMTFRWTYRLDGKPAWRSAMTPANGSASQSPFVVLATRA